MGLAPLVPAREGRGERVGSGVVGEEGSVFVAGDAAELGGAVEETVGVAGELSEGVGAGGGVELGEEREGGPGGKCGGGGEECGEGDGR